MMGVFRVYLALCVIQAHTDQLFPNWFPSLNGREAVQAFYAISGFYIAMILNLKYVAPGQTTTFYVNRILRLWPPYLVVALLAAVLMSWTGYLPAMIEQIRTFPLAAQVLIALSNLFIIGQDALWFFHFQAGSMSFAPFETTDATNGYRYSLIVVMFTVSIEFMFYGVAPFVVRRISRALGFAAIGLAYHALLLGIGERHVAYTYQFFPSAIWFFAIGVLAFHVYLRYRKTFTDRPGLMALPSIAVAIVICLIGKKMFFPETRIAYVSLAVASLLPTLHALSQRIRVDREIGELSYGLYLTHIPIIYAYQYFLGEVRAAPVALLSILAAALLYVAVERPIDRLRQRLVRPRAPTSSQGEAVGPLDDLAKVG
jgi:peptidoglycan/LPS O-acetylase OafA/YrhL